MESWPLERIAILDFRAVTAIVQSVAQAELSQRNPLSFEARAARVCIHALGIAWA